MAGRDEVNFQLLAEHSVDMICMVDLDLVMQYASPACHHILGWTPEEMCGKGPEAFVCPEDLPIIGVAHKHLLANGVDDTPTTVRMRKKDGAFLWVEINARLVRDKQQDEIKGVVLTIRDATARKLREEELEAQALRDSLTGLANRRLFDHVLEREWNHMLRDGSPLSLILLDIDCFKQFNDYYGHVFGDNCLRVVAFAVRDAVSRAVDFVARYGGEELAIILPGTDSEGAVKIAENVRARIEALQLPHKGNLASEWVTASFGVATALARHGGIMKMPEGLLLAADHALYKAKHEGRNRIAVSHLLVSQDEFSME